ncbi:oligosaccharyl transferase, archaeosortase A system-associated [Chloroflexota bacterium]
MTCIRYSPTFITCIIITIFIGISVYFRIILPYDKVFSGELVIFSEVDAYYHIRLVENMLHNFPQRIVFDPYTSFPNGHIIFWPPFYDWLLSGSIWLIDLGAPSQRTIEVVSAYIPAILGTITIIPVYFIGKVLFNRWAGIISAGLVTILPGGFLARSLLGWTDHHVAEVLLSTVAMLFLILAIKSACQNQIMFRHLLNREIDVIRKPIIYSLLAGVFLGFYNLSWAGGPLFIFIIFLYFVIQSIIDHLRNLKTEYNTIIDTLIIFTALVISLPWLPEGAFSGLVLPALLIALITPSVLIVISDLFKKRKFKKYYYPLFLFGSGLAGVLIISIVSPSLLDSMLMISGMLNPISITQTIGEVQPLLFPKGDFTILPAWNQFTTSLFLGIAGLGTLCYLVYKQGSADKSLFAVWSIMILAATLGQARFSYYLTINMALLTGYFSWYIISTIDFKRFKAKPVEAKEKERREIFKRRKSPNEKSITAGYIGAIVVVLVMFSLVFLPNINKAIGVSKYAGAFPDDTWIETLSWLRENTPEPFGDPDEYYKLYQPPPIGENYNYPESAYGVMSWWDYGHWITRIAHRIPVSNPFQSGARATARFFTAQDENAANSIMNEVGAKYVIVDSTTVREFSNVASWVKSNHEKFYETFYLSQNGTLHPIRLYYPEYYRAFAIRLYNFNGEQVTAQNAKVISYEPKTDRKGNAYKIITSSRDFPSYEEANNYVLDQKTENYSIVGEDQFISPVPLEALEQYQLVYDSRLRLMHSGARAVPKIRIFEFIQSGD